ncbi:MULTISPECIES: YlmC/YmxH family sporulation protein [Vallitalea]|jgi:YlmC/YmxH family sporulation protein|uniref:YlmC/YmxH family sporulation protein n=2 Tax=Vallitalea TaxID=1348611 RepID=A0A8J8MEZ6_9FIRM|nr:MULTISPECIES: YlmC/YmxH family sporulation protein [Vallitalea]MCT4688209.1 YlmC/YmxH family sporulation protein [Vallitalea sp.]QUH31425.1 YlmC/YmxH family sporulation protein [Vallitalea guaymasensis]GMQ65051.1 YlmC/YmxH family sporulation protein [Vallitalea sp. AN17-2]
MVRIYDMKQKEVINSNDGIRLGFISDIEVDLQEGKLIKLIVPGPAKIFGMFGRGKEYQIPWDSIKKIGEDIILVDINVDKSLVESEY